MRLLISLLLVCGGAHATRIPSFSVVSGEPGAWPEILSCIGLEAQPAAQARILIARAGSAATEQWPERVEQGAILILEGPSELASQLGFRPSRQNVRVVSLVDEHRPALSIVWQKALDLPVFTVPDGARVFARERWSGAPLTAGLRRGRGAVLWLAASPGDHGYERFPYLLAALRDLGLDPPFRSARLWAFFDEAYRTRVDLEYFAARWRKAGISALHVAAWRYFEPDTGRDAYLRRLIEICHREGILIYAWLELPHVSQQFWAGHPEWREKTALLQDAELDWRKLMNLTNRDCFRAVSSGVSGLIRRFDWDGVNLAELYFESLEGIGNPARFTPMNPDVRAAFRARHGFDPIQLFSTRADPASRRKFLDFRAELARKMQEEWMAVLESSRREKPDLDLVLTHIDDRLDPEMRNAIGADAARVLPLLNRHSFTFLIEEPATLWHLRPQRYADLAGRYAALTTHRRRLAIDLNIVERYQDVYPTKQQVGIELFQLIHEAGSHFHRVALYFENSLAPPDLDFLPAAAAAVNRAEQRGESITIDTEHGTGLLWKGAALVDGQPWPASDDETVWLPAGRHSLAPGPALDGPRLLRLNGELLSALALTPTSLEFQYDSPARAIAVLDRPASRIRVDGRDRVLAQAGPSTILLPHGRHTITIFTE